MKKRQIEIAVINNPILGKPGDKMQELLTYLGSIAPGILVLAAPTRGITSAEAASYPYTRFIGKLRALSQEGSRIVWLSRDNEIPGIDFIEFTKETDIHTRSNHAWFPPEEVRELNEYLASIYLNTGLMTYGMLRLLGNLGGLQSRGDTLCLKKLARIAQQRGYTEVVLPTKEKPFRKLQETKYGNCLVMSPGDWSRHLTSLEFTFKRWKTYSYDHDKLLPFFADELLKSMNAGDLQKLADHTDHDRDPLSLPA